MQKGRFCTRDAAETTVRVQKGRFRTREEAETTVRVQKGRFCTREEAETTVRVQKGRFRTRDAAETTVREGNRVGGKQRILEVSSYFLCFPTSHTTVRAVRHTAVPYILCN